MNGTTTEDINQAVLYHNGTSNNEPSGWNAGCFLYVFIIRCIFIGIFCIVGLIGNITSFCVFQFDSLKTSTTFLFQSLCVTDSCLLICVFPLYCVESFSVYTERYNYLYTIGPYVYVYLFPVSAIAHSATIWLTVLVGVNRFIAVCVPYKAARLCTVSKAKQYVVIVILASILYNLPRFFAFHVPKYGDVADYTSLGKNHIYRVTYENICYLIFILTVPLLILTVLNIRLIKALKDLKKRRSEMQTRQQQQDNNVTLVLVVVVLVFSVCQLPSLINHLLWTIYPQDQRECMRFHWYLRHICNLLVVVNSATNFLIYMIFNTRFRGILLQRLFRVQCSNNGATTCNGASQTLLSKI